MAGRAAEVLTELDDDNQPQGGANNNAGGDDSLALLRQGGEDPGNEPEFTIADEDDGQGEARLTEEEVGDRPQIGEGRVYSREEIAQMSPEQRRKVWQGMDPDDRRRNRHLGRVRQKDARRDGVAHTRDLERQVADQAQTIERLSQQVGGFAPRLDEYGRAQIQGKIAEYDRRTAELGSAINAANQKIKDAMTSGDGEALVAAMDERTNATIQRAEIDAERKAFQRTIDTVGGDQQQQRQQQPRQQQQQPPQPQLAPQGQRFLREFMEDNPWYDNRAHMRGGSGDLDSITLTMIDTALAREGYNPNTQEYWDELAERAKERLPWRYDEDDAPRPQQRAQNGNGRQQQPQRQQQQQRQPQRRGPMTGGNGEGVPRRPGGGAVQVRLNAERKQALIEVGALDRDGRTPLDKVKLNKYLKQYDQYDRENGGARQ